MMVVPDLPVPIKITGFSNLFSFRVTLILCTLNFSQNTIKLQVTYLKIDLNIPAQAVSILTKKLTPAQRTRNSRFHRKIDQLRNLFGYLLLSNSWKQTYQQPMDLSKIQFSESHRPYLPNHEGDFNISHSGDYVICVLSGNARVGIDIERRRAVDFSDFTATMNEMQWVDIKKSKDPNRRFFQYWTMKESVIKADGRGLSIPLTDITIIDDQVHYDEKRWFLHQFQLDDLHPGCLATNEIIDQPVMNQINWDVFL